MFCRNMMSDTWLGKSHERVTKESLNKAIVTFSYGLVKKNRLFL